MIDDYMPVRLNLPDDARVLKIAEVAKIDDDAATGKLIRVWAWAQTNSVDGRLDATDRVIDRIAGKAGFAAAMRAAGWLKEVDGRPFIPEWEKWNSKSAKRRAAERTIKRISRGQNDAEDEDERPESVPNENENLSGQTSGHMSGRSVSLSVSVLELRKKKEDENFAEFWKAFPTRRKTHKGTARKAFAAAVKKADAETIIAAAAEFAASPKGLGDFCPAPSAWLNGECWEDDRAAWHADQSASGKNGRAEYVRPQIPDLTDDDVKGIPAR